MFVAHSALRCAGVALQPGSDERLSHFWGTQTLLMQVK